MSDCLFCRIVADEIPAERVSETPESIAIRDIAPAAPTHLLVIPRTHYATLGEAVSSDDAGIVGALFGHAQAVADAAGLTGGFRLVVNTGADGGQTVDHLHIHVLGGRPHSWPPG
ncbi:MAG: histidine triad nucleotide-binding protein [Candidatus Nanopelagicales bacterium]